LRLRRDGRLVLVRQAARLVRRCRKLSHDVYPFLGASPIMTIIRPGSASSDRQVQSTVG
jgi:hypothetical protein